MGNFIFKSSGHYLGFLINNNIFSRDGVYLGWVENNFVWDKDGGFRGQLMSIDSHTYILKNQYAITPLPKVPKTPPATPTIPAPPANILPIITPLGFKDAF